MATQQKCNCGCRAVLDKSYFGHINDPLFGVYLNHHPESKRYLSTQELAEIQIPAIVNNEK